MIGPPRQRGGNHVLQKRNCMLPRVWSKYQVNTILTLVNVNHGEGIPADTEFSRFFNGLLHQHSCELFSCVAQNFANPLHSNLNNALLQKLTLFLNSNNVFTAYLENTELPTTEMPAVSTGKQAFYFLCLLLQHQRGSKIISFWGSYWEYKTLLKFLALFSSF